MTSSDRDGWDAAWEQLGAVPKRGLLAALQERYAEPQRVYHTIRHIRECLSGLLPVREQADHPAEVELALWFHDAIYDPRANDNEEKSAAWAESEMLEAGAPAAAARRVRDLVLATRHDGAPSDGDGRLLVDVDRSILGSSEARFDEYERQIREEYVWVPEPAYREGRSQILRVFLARPAIFSTHHFAARLEAPARQNLERSLESLGVADFAIPGP